MRDGNVKMLSTIHTALYRATGGWVGRRLVNNDMLLLTTTGRSTGKPHTVPLLFLKDGERLVVIASYGGRPSHPQWYHNLLLEPSASVQILADTRDVVATPMTARERDQWWPRVVDAYGDYEVYQSRTDREIPVLWLD